MSFNQAPQFLLSHERVGNLKEFFVGKPEVSPVDLNSRALLFPHEHALLLVRQYAGPDGSAALLRYAQ